MDLRPYQATGINEIREHFKGGRRKVLFWLATGGGKTHCFSHMMIETMNRGRKCLMIVRGRKLVDQASRRLFRENVTHGVMMAGHWNFRPRSPIQICSIDTLIARGWRPPADLIVIDEAHQAVSDGYREFLADYPNAYIVAVTATPYSSKSLRHIADEIVHPISVNELIEQNFLVGARYYAPSNPDVSRVKVSKQTGDYVQNELAAIMDKSAITGDIISHWQKLASDRPTIAFAVSVEHSKNLVAQFVKAGIPAEHCDADTPEKKREEIIARLERGDTKVVSNVGILCTGVDIPCVAAIISARPTQSYNLYIQQAGRGTRIFPGKKDFLLLDHAGNVHRHGFITDEPEPNLEGRKFSSALGGRARTCKQCFAIVEAFPCPAEMVTRDENDKVMLVACGWSPPKEENGPREILHIDGELAEIKAPSLIDRRLAEDFCREALAEAVSKNRSPWGAYYKTITEFGDQNARIVFFKLCKAQGIKLERKKKEEYPFK